MKRPDWEKYCRKHPANALPPGDYRRAVVIPAWDECLELPPVLDSLSAALPPEGPTAVIVAVNHPPDAAAAPSLELLALLAEYAPANRDISILPLYLPELKGGVGAARAAGMDAFTAITPPEKAGDTLIYSLDADSPVAPEYFKAVERTFAAHPAAVAVVPGFRHRTGADAAQEAAIREYEAWQRRYVERLRAAGSPYGFYTIGSAMVCRVESYIRCGGMKHREAGEDFYFMQDLAKTGQVISLDEVLVHPSPRTSGRVPFGTGPAVKKLLAGIPPEEISDAAFAELGQLLARSREADALDSADGFFGLVAGERTREFLRQEGFLRIWDKVIANQPPSGAARIAAFDRWFDGLKTLRFLHWMMR